MAFYSFCPIISVELLSPLLQILIPIHEQNHYPYCRCRCLVFVHKKSIQEFAAVNFSNRSISAKVPEYETVKLTASMPSNIEGSATSQTTNIQLFHYDGGYCDVELKCLLLEDL